MNPHCFYIFLFGQSQDQSSFLRFPHTQSLPLKQQTIGFPVFCHTKLLTVYIPLGTKQTHFQGLHSTGSADQITHCIFPLQQASCSQEGFAKKDLGGPFVLESACLLKCPSSEIQHIQSDKWQYFQQRTWCRVHASFLSPRIHSVSKVPCATLHVDLIWFIFLLHSVIGILPFYINGSSQLKDSFFKTLTGCSLTWGVVAPPPPQQCLLMHHASSFVFFILLFPGVRLQSSDLLSTNVPQACETELQHGSIQLGYMLR